jgi:hypothetical protein
VLLKGGSGGGQRVGLKAEGVVQLLANLHRAEEGWVSISACMKQPSPLPTPSAHDLHACMPRA